MPELDAVFWAVHSDLDREGPGDEASLRRALAAVPDLGAVRRILDVGCGAGAQSLDLAALTGAAITSVDNHQPFLDDLAAKARARGLASRITPLRASMAELPFADASFELIWSEGAAYLMGFERAVARWRRLLTPGGVLAVSEACWLRPPDQVSAGARQAWAEYPAMTTREGVVAQVAGAGYRILDAFVLPPPAWQAYYGPIEAKIARLRQAHRDDPAFLAGLDIHQREVDDYRQFGSEYSYVFVVAQSI